MTSAVEEPMHESGSVDVDRQDFVGAVVPATVTLLRVLYALNVSPRYAAKLMWRLHIDERRETVG